MGKKGEAFCERLFALHCHQTENDKQNFDVAPNWKNFGENHWYSIEVTLKLPK